MVLNMIFSFSLLLFLSQSGIVGFTLSSKISTQFLVMKSVGITMGLDQLPKIWLVLLITLELEDLLLVGSSFIFSSNGLSSALVVWIAFSFLLTLGNRAITLCKKLSLRWSQIIFLFLSNECCLKSFRIFNTWCNDKDLQNLVFEAWQELNSSSSSFWFKFC